MEHYKRTRESQDYNFLDLIDEQPEKIDTIHIWLKQRNGRKCFTDVTGLSKDLNKKKIIKYWRHEFHCSVSKNEENIRLQGDQRENVYNFLIRENIIEKEYIKIHGF